MRVERRVEMSSNSRKRFTATQRRTGDEIMSAEPVAILGNPRHFSTCHVTVNPSA